MEDQYTVAYRSTQSEVRSREKQRLTTTDNVRHEDSKHEEAAGRWEEGEVEEMKRAGKARLNNSVHAVRAIVDQTKANRHRRNTVKIRRIITEQGKLRRREGFVIRCLGHMRCNLRLVCPVRQKNAMPAHAIHQHLTRIVIQYSQYSVLKPRGITLTLCTLTQRNPRPPICPQEIAVDSATVTRS